MVNNFLQVVLFHKISTYICQNYYSNIFLLLFCPIIVNFILILSRLKLAPHSIKINSISFPKNYHIYCAKKLTGLENKFLFFLSEKEWYSCFLNSKFVWCSFSFLLYLKFTDFWTQEIKDFYLCILRVWKEKEKIKTKVLIFLYWT